MQEKKHFKNQTLLKNTTNYKGKSVEFAINVFDNLYYNHCDLITKFWPGSTKWNTPFIKA